MSWLEENNLKKKLIHNGTWLYIFSFLIAPSGYLLKVMIARELSVEDIGLFYSIIWIITIISTYNDLWLTEALQYFLPRYLLKQEISKATSLIRFTRGMQFFTWIIISWLLFFGAPRLAEHYFTSSLALPILRIFCIYFLIINLYQVLSSLFFSTQQVKRAQMIDFIRMWSVVFFTAASIFLWESFDLLMYSWYWLWGVIMGLIVASIWCIKLYPRIIRTSLISIRQHLSIKERTTYWRRIMLWQSASTLYGQVNQQLVLVILGSAAAGIRAYYLTFFSIISILTSPLIGYLFPLFTELQAKWDITKIKKVYSYLIAWMIVFGLLGWIGWYYFSQTFIVFLYGEAFRQSGELFQIFAPWVILLPMTGIIYNDLASRGLVKQRVYVTLIWLGILSITTPLLISVYGIYWGVYGHILWSISLLFVLVYVYKKNLSLYFTSQWEKKHW